jgi:hypothetical protein
LRREEGVDDQLVEGLGAEVSLRHPADGLDVAQSTGTRLDVGLEVVAGIVVAVVASLLLGDFRFEEGLRRPDVVLAERAPHRLEQMLGAGEQPRFDEGRGDADVGSAFTLAVVDRAHAVTHLESDVPEEGEETLDALMPFVEVALWQQDQDIDVGAGM